MKIDLLIAVWHDSHVIKIRKLGCHVSVLTKVVHCSSLYLT